MAQYKVEESSLTEVADAIREKSGSNEALEFPVGYTNAIRNMSGGTSVQSDWNQTDETAADFIKNKPFGDEVTEILPLSNVQFVYDETEGLYCASIETSESISNGDTVVVNWDGVTYSGAALDGGFAVMFGNFSLVGMEDTGEPYVAMCAPGMIVLFDLFATGDTVRNVSISKVEKTKISAEYLPGVITTYYFDSFDGGYVYSDIACTEKVTRGKAALDVMYGIVSLQLISSAIRVTPTICDFNDICYYFECADGQIFYTAEYTPE